MACCPVHEDSTPSLHVTWRRGHRGGGVLVFCHGCQAQADQIAEALGLTLADLFDEPLPERDRSTTRVGKSVERRRAGRRRGRLGPLPEPLVTVQRTTADDGQVPEDLWREVRRYPYTDHEGRLVQEVIREEAVGPDGKRHKRFRQIFVTREGRRVKRKPPEFYPVLFRAPEVKAAVRDGQAVWLLEGEKDVETAEAQGLVATTNTQGGKSFPSDLVDELAGAHVVVVLDRDATGWARGVDLHTKLTAAGAKVSLRLPAVLEDKADFTDHIEAGFTLEELERVAVDEVRTWDTLSAVLAKAKMVRLAVEETRARWALVEEGTDKEENQRFARRWALEAQIRHEALRDLVDQVYAHACKVGTVWVGDAMEAADAALAEATDLARKVHLEVGVAVPESLRAAAVEDAPADQSPATTTYPGSPNPEQGRWHEAGVGAEAPTFRILNGQIVQWEPSRGRRNDDEEDPGKLKVLLSTVVKVTCREYLEVDSDQDVDETQLMGRSGTGKPRVSAPRTLVAVRLAYPDPATGETMEIRVMADQWRDHSWLEALPGQPDYDHRKAGLDVLQRAILAISDNVVDEVLYRATGWREDPDGSHRFIHRRGAITASGHEDAEVAFSGPLVRYDLPDPVQDPKLLRKAWFEASATMLDRIPGRISAPLLGQVFRAVLGHNEWVLTLVGPPGSYKTSVAAKAMHHFGERWDHKKPASSMSGNGDTFNALRFKLHNAKDTLYWMDDFAPTKSWLEAQKHLEETARLLHNQEERSRSSRDGLSISDGTGPRASGLCTSEVMPRPGSGSERMLVVPLTREDIDTAQLFPLDEPMSRYGRAVLMSSYISWLASALKAKVARYMQIAEEYADQLVKQEGETVRQSAAIAHTWAGWVAVTDFLVDRKALTVQERQDLLVRVDAMLREAGRAAVNPDMPRTTGARVRELLAYALRQGIAYVDDVRTGECPPWPLAGRLGWRRTTTETDHLGNAHRIRVDRNGIRLGYVLHDPDPTRERGRVLMCDSTQLEAVLKAASSTQAEKLEIDRSTACRALLEEGVLIPDRSEGRTRHTVKCRIYCEDRTARMVTLYLDEIIGSDDDPVEGLDDPQGPDAGGSGTASDGQPAIPGLDPAGAPHLVDAPAVSEDSGSVVDDHHDEQSGTDHPEQESTVTDSYEFTPRPYFDRDGVVGYTERSTGTGPCVMCGKRCGVTISGLLIHLPCWEWSSAQERADAVRRQQGEQAPLPVTPEPTAPSAEPAAQVPAPAPARPVRSTPGSTPAAQTSFTAAAAVVDVDGIWLSDGRHLPLPGEGPEHVGDLVDLAQQLRLGTATTKYLPASGQIWLADRLAEQMGINVEAIAAASDQDKDKVAREITKGCAVVTEAIEAGYSIGGKDGDSLGRWTRVWKGQEKSTWVVLMPAVSRTDIGVPLLQGDPDHASLARRIGLLAGALGMPFQLSGSTTGLDLMMALRWKDRERFFAVREPIPPAQQSNIETDLNWTRKPTTAELEHQWVHAYDRSGSYLAGVSGLELGVGEAQHHPDGTEFTPRVPGYWRIEIPQAGDWRMPNPLDPRGINAGKQRWVTTPALEFAIEQGYEPEIIEAYTWPERARVLDPWYERIRDARTALDVPDPDRQAARDQLKAIYAPTIGMLGSQIHMAGRRGYAPDWRHLIIAKARTNILRRVARIGLETDRWPIAIMADTVLYTSDEADPVKAWPGGEKALGRELGRYKVEGSAPLQQQLQFFTGGPYKGKDEIAGRVPGSE